MPAWIPVFSNMITILAFGGLLKWADISDSLHLRLRDRTQFLCILWTWLSRCPEASEHLWKDMAMKFSNWIKGQRKSLSALCFWGGRGEGMARGLKCYGTGNSYKIPSLVPTSAFSPSQAFRKPPTENWEKGRSGENEKIKVGKGTEFTVSPYNSQSKWRKRFVFSPEHVTSFTKVHW